MLLGNFPHMFDEGHPPFFSQWGDRHTDQLAVVAGVQAEIGSKDCPLDGAHLAHIPRLYRDQIGLRRVEGRHLANRCGNAIVLHHHMIQQMDRGATRA